MMHLSRFLFFAAAVHARTCYKLTEDYHAESMDFFDKFEFFNDQDPTNGPVQYVDKDTALQQGLIGNRDGKTYMGVDFKTPLDGIDNRTAVRVESTETYTHGLFIADIEHMPGGICGTWPAWWLSGSVEPRPDPDASTGEIDIIEGANSSPINGVTLWSYQEYSQCTVDNKDSSTIGRLETSDCHGNADGVGGCEIDDTRENSFGTQFNEENGGVYAAEWTSEFIRVYFLPRSQVEGMGDGSPLSSDPDPSTWGKPVADFSGDCDLEQAFRKLKMIFNITFCGDMGSGDMGSGDMWTNDSVCSAKADTCESYVREHPEAFEDAYWLLNSVKVYQK